MVAVNGVGEKVSVVQKDAGLLERGKQVRRLGVNLVTADFFDAGTPARRWLAVTRGSLETGCSAADGCRDSLAAQCD